MAVQKITSNWFHVENLTPLDDGVAFIRKPFSMADMTAKVREALEMALDKNQK